MARQPPSIALPEDEDGREALRAHLQTLGQDVGASTARIELCETIAASLARVGQVLWVSGALIGPHRVSRESRHGFGDDRVVGVATLAQIGGELAGGIIDLLHSGNRYAAAALVRQLLEVEYLAHAFAGEHESAAAWLRADRGERRAFWTPHKLRARADGAFIDEHYWAHCDRGGHPTSEGMALLPDHSWQIDSVMLWIDLAGHLASVWTYVMSAPEVVSHGPDQDGWKFPDVDAALKAWRTRDRLYAALQSLGTAPHGDG